MKQKTKIAVFFLAIFVLAGVLQAQRNMENIDRAVVAIRTSSSQVFVSWRMLGTDPSNVTFNLYRGSSQIASTSATNYTDNTSSNSTYYVRAVIGGSEQTASKTASVWTTSYLNISLNRPSGGTTPDNVSYTYSPNDCSIGDLDGDGDYEIVLKWDPSNSKDNSQSGYTGKVYLDAYELNGNQLWRIDLGWNIRAGAHYTQFMVYDLDSDGKAEVACKTADGTRDGQNNVIGSSSADYRNSSGYILSGPEYFTIFNGETGAAMVTTNYLPARGTVSDWGDSYGNRVDRFLACIAYLDGSQPSVVMCRGYYTRMVLVAWDWRNNSLSQRWTFDTDNGYSSWEGQGNHNLSVADVDGDGYDEIIYGSCTIDHDGDGLWNTGLGHGDAMHVSDINPNRSGLEVWGIHEGSSTPGSALLAASNGQILWQTSNTDVGRGVSADLTSSYAGMECWGGTSGLRSCTNASAGSSPSSSNFVMWWDGDLLRELEDGTAISKYGGSTLLSDGSCSSNNGTKSTPCLTADILGDWREEVIWRTSDNSNLRLYSTTTSTSERIYTLMHDPTYRLGVAWQNVAYNQPPHTGFFLGNGMSTPPTPNIVLVGGGQSNNPPSVSITSPSNGASYTAPASITITADASDSDGSVSSVAFYQNSSLLGTDYSSPYSYSWSNVSAGTYSLTAVATDNESATTTSTAITVYVTTSGSSITIQENETGFCNVDGTVDNNNSGYTGDGFANTDNATGNGIDWKINVLTGGTYTFTWRYANGSSDRPADLIVGTSTLSSDISFPSTSSWTTWDVVSVNVSLSTGTQDVRLEATGSGGLANIDYIQITGSSVAAASCQGSSGLVAGYTYQIFNVGSGKVLEVANASTSNAATVQQYTDSDGTHQQWTLNDAGSGYYNLEAVHSGQFMDVYGASTSDGADIIQYPENGGTNQDWTLDEVSSGVYRIIARHSGKCIGIENYSSSDGANVEQQTDASSNYQRWTFTLVSTSKPVAKEAVQAMPTSFALDQNFPNPFNPETSIGYQLPETGNVKLEIYDVLGKKIKTLMTKEQLAGYYTVNWNAINDNGMVVPSGIYYYRIQVITANEVFSSTRKMLLLK